MLIDVIKSPVSSARLPGLVTFLMSGCGVGGVMQITISFKQVMPMHHIITPFAARTPEAHSSVQINCRRILVDSWLFHLQRKYFS
jgi:hypothetical protein